MWFGIVSALLIMAFMIQCCREVARAEADQTAMVQSADKFIPTVSNPMNTMGTSDPRSLLSPGKLTEDTAFKANAYLMHTK